MPNVLCGESAQVTAQEEDGESEVISIRDACRILNVHRNTLYKLIREGEIPAFRLIRGGRWRFFRQDLKDWLQVRQARRKL